MVEVIEFLDSDEEGEERVRVLQKEDTIRRVDDGQRDNDVEIVGTCFLSVCVCVSLRDLIDSLRARGFSF